MMNINLIISLTIFINLSHAERINGFNINRSESEIDCSKYQSDNQILRSFPYFVDLNPTVKIPTIPHAKMNDDFKIYSLTIINENSVPSQIYCLKHLTKLEIKDMDTGGKFPVDIKYLPLSLIELGIYNTKIIQIPKEIGQLKQLEILILSNANLVSIPDSIGYLTKLIIINFEKNNLTKLPKTMKNLKDLTEIFLSYNPRLYSIEPLNGLPSLKTVHAVQCSIPTLPQNLPSLDELNLLENKLITLDGIQTLGNGTNSKKYFSFGKNYIHSIPPQIESVRDLYVLDLHRNRLHNLPTNIYSAKTLVDLNIKQNPFRHQDLPIILSELSKALPNLKVSHN